MAILNPNEIFFTAFEPKLKNRFILYVDGIPAYLIKGVSGMGFSQEEITLNHINVYRKIKGKLKWNDLTLRAIKGDKRTKTIQINKSIPLFCLR
jgi:hypothetical protein